MSNTLTKKQELEVAVLYDTLKQLPGGEKILDYRDHLNEAELMEACMIIVENIMDYIFVGLKEKNPVLAQGLFDLVNQKDMEGFFDVLLSLLSMDPYSKIIVEKGFNAGYFAVKNKFKI